MKKKIIALLVAVMMLSVLAVGCGGSKETASEDDKEKTYVVKVGYENQPGEPIDEGVKKWAELAEEKSNGKLKIEVYPSSQLGTKVDAFEQMQLGQNIIYIADAGFLMDYVPDLGILSAPYLVESYDDLFSLFETEWFAGLDKQLNDKGLHIVSSKWIYGDRHLLTTKKVEKPADLKGLKIRVPNNKLSIETFEAMGATPTPMPLGDVYPALQQGVVNGAENPLPVLYGSKQHEVATNLALTGHTNMIITWIAGQQFMESLPEDIRTVLKETADEAGVFNNELTSKQAEETLAKFEAEGVTITEVDKGAFKEATKATYAQFPEWTEGLYDKIQEMVK